MHTSNFVYYHDQQELHGFLAYKEETKVPCPAVLVAPDWTGRNEFACQKAIMLAEMGYVGFVLDVYGLGRCGATNDEKMALMQPFVIDRNLLKNRLNSALNAVKAMPEVDTNHIAMIGFCFGGLCALDLARSGADIKGAVSFHGLLDKPDMLQPQSIKAKILALHGYEDPMVTPEQVNAFCQEMTVANVDWQIHMYGHVQHAFTNPDAHDVPLGLIYNTVAAQRSWQAMSLFLNEILRD